MSKKKKKKNKDKVLSWAKFIRKYCSRCSVCTSNINAKFCHALYLKDPEGWKESIFPTLSEPTTFLSIKNHKSVSSRDFIEMFCARCDIGDSFFFGECSSLNHCFTEFNKQIRKSRYNRYDHVDNKQKEKPKPVFFTNNPEKWNAIIRKTLYKEKVG